MPKRSRLRTQLVGSAACRIGVSEKPSCSIDLLNGWAACASTRWSVAKTAARHAIPRHSFAPTPRGLIPLHHDRIYNTLHFLLLCLEFILLRELVLVEPVKRVLHSLFNFFFVAVFKFLLELFLIERVAHCETIVFQAILCFDFNFLLLVLGAVLFRLLH